MRIDILADLRRMDVLGHMRGAIASEVALSDALVNIGILGICKLRCAGSQGLVYPSDKSSYIPFTYSRVNSST
jgi:hypothetical protein